MTLLRIILAMIAGLVVLWLVLIALLWRYKPDERRARDLLRLLPDLVGLMYRLARDSTLPRGVRVRLWLLVGYLAMPFDLVPDFIPIIGYADDVVITVLVLRSVVRKAGMDAVERHWTGTPEGLDAVVRLARLGQTTPKGGD